MASETGRNDSQPASQPASQPHQTETRRPRDTHAVLNVREDESREEDKEGKKESRDSLSLGLVKSILEFCFVSQARSLCHDGSKEFTFTGFCCGPEAASLIHYL